MASPSAELWFLYAQAQRGVIQSTGKLTVMYDTERGCHKKASDYFSIPPMKHQLVSGRSEQRPNVRSTQGRPELQTLEELLATWVNNKKVICEAVQEEE